ncbi:hypothetical protein BGZ95_003085 [Linnemannia exigua]|uniref:Uncharacterized protein n=1 Tax=Linnemannia exigua TaxID=604196 RepID=A0AAD4DI43_9FUNG|nr:hypothetical protein BGZ95_003085 [Linnemannia exigua]
MFKSILLVGLALAASLVVKAKPDIVFATGNYMQGYYYRCEELDYQVCYTWGSLLFNVKSFTFTNYDFPDHKDFSITVYDGPSCNNYYDRWSFKQSDDGKDTIAGWFSLPGVYSFKIANFMTSEVHHGKIGMADSTRNPHCWCE